MNVTRYPSGNQYDLSHGSLRAAITSVGASLRKFTIDGRDLVVPYSEKQLRPAYRGTTIAPWPNRIVDGRYTWQGKEHQLPLNEPDRRHALHGLTPWLQFLPTELSQDAVTLCAFIEPQDGYPWRIQLETRYALAENGLTQTVIATNLSDDDAPYGTCPHPYLVAGHGPVDRWTLRLPANEVLLVGEERLEPQTIAAVDIDRERFDFREPRTIAQAEIDHAFTGIMRERNGEARVEVRGESGDGVAMVWDESCQWVQIHTADLPNVRPEQNRIGLAVEPQTCAPDAFNVGDSAGLVVLSPGEKHTAQWRIEPLFGQV